MARPPTSRRPGPWARLRERVLGRVLGPRPPCVRVHVVLKGRIGDGWQDVDRVLELPRGATLATLFERCEQQGIPLRDAVDKSPHLRHTLMWNGERCPVDEHLGRALVDGDQVYLLAPLAGG